MTDILQKLFGSSARVKLLRLFLFNPRQSFSVAEAADRSRSSIDITRREFAHYLSTGLIKRLRRQDRSARYQLNADFGYITALQNLLLNAPERGKDIYERIRRTGTIKLLIISGIFLNEWEAKLDIMIVGDKVNERKLRMQIRKLESEIGKELRYALLPTDNFVYRLSMNDHLVRDVFDFPHSIAYDRLDIGLQ